MALQQNQASPSTLPVSGASCTVFASSELMWLLLLNGMYLNHYTEQIPIEGKDLFKKMSNPDSHLNVQNK